VAIPASEAGNAEGWSAKPTILRTAPQAAPRAVARFDLVVVGGGLTTARAIRAYREAGGQGLVALFTRDRQVPYHRPPLSKRFLRGEVEEADTFVEPASYYDEHAVLVHLETPIARIDVDSHEVQLASGERHAYGKLLLATGAWPRTLDVPGGDLDGVTTFRTLHDSSGVKAAAAGARRALVVGGSFIGSEVTASLRRLGVDVTLLHRGTGIFDSLGSAELSEHLTRLYRQEGVEVLYGDEVRAFHGNGRVTGAETRGGRRIDADLVVVGVGVDPVVDLLEGTGIGVDDGIVVDERYRTSAPDVFAAGDIANFPDPLFGRRRRIEHWSNANYQGSEVGKVLAGGEGGYDVVSSFFSEVFGYTFKVFGDLAQYDDFQLHGSLEDGRAVGHYLAEGRLVGALSVGQDEEAEQALKDAIAAHTAPPQPR
jgi:NADPH-dependent 2,4-dienoyl-CoA reductase/sulfur reductase-like enzyme